MLKVLLSLFLFTKQILSNLQVLNGCFTHFLWLPFHFQCFIYSSICLVSANCVLCISTDFETFRHFKKQGLRILNVPISQLSQSQKYAIFNWNFEPNSHWVYVDSCE